MDQDRPGMDRPGMERPGAVGGMLLGDSVPLLGEGQVPLGALVDQQQTTESEINRRYQAVRSKANKLNISGEEITASAKDLKMNCELGNGSCGTVFKMSFRGQLMAVKTMAKTSNQDELKRIIMDLDVVTRAGDCPNIVHSYGYFITDEKVMVCMELMATCLDRLLRRTNHQPVPEAVIAQIALSVLTALNYLKEKHSIIHRDVKPSNILLDWNGIVKLCDFGISGKLIQSKVYTRQAGCPPYMAPERLNPNAPPSYDIRSDVWSVGLTMVELARGIYPYAHCQSEFEIFSAIIEKDPPFIKEEEGFSPEFVDFVRLLLQKNVENRPKYPVLLAHPFIEAARTANTDVSEWFANLMKIDE